MLTRKDFLPYQTQLVERMASKSQLAVFLDPGMGKTICSLTAIVDLKPKKTLIVAPKFVADTVWEQESQLWEHTQQLTFCRIKGTPAQRSKKLATNTADIDLASYSLLAWLVKTTKFTQYDCIIFDELSKLKSPSTKMFRALRKPILKIPRRYGLTGTPVGNSLLNLWAEMYSVAGTEPFGGMNYSQFRGRFFMQVGDFMWKPFKDTEDRVKRMIEPWVFTAPKTETNGELKINRISVRMDPKDKARYDSLEESFYLELGQDNRLEVFNSISCQAKLRQLASGFVYVHPMFADNRTEYFHTKKLDALDRLVESLQGEPLLLFYQFEAEKELILSKFKQAVHIQDYGNAVDLWNDRQFEIMLAHPASAGHGLNLQKGGHNIAWYSLPWSFELYKQANARLSRKGQKAAYVLVHILETEETIDQIVFGGLEANKRVEDRVFEYFRSKYRDAKPRITHRNRHRKEA